MRRFRSIVPLAALFLLVAGVALAAPKKFVGSSDSKEDDEPQKFLPDYDQLVKGKEADWVWFPVGVDLKSFKVVRIEEFTTTGKGGERGYAADQGPRYLEQWIEDSKLGWRVAERKEKADLVISGNVFSAWEPNAAAEFFAPEGMANPGCGIELIGRSADGKTAFEIRHKSRGSTISDAVENGLEDVVQTLVAGR